MISQFSSLIEFLAAIYVSMSLDNDFCKRFWTPNFFKEIDNVFSNFQIENELVYDKIEGSIKDKSENIQNSSLKRGGFMLGFCVFLLIYIGFEDGTKCSDPYYNLPISIICLAVIFITSFLYKYVFKNWRFVVYLLTFIIVGFFFLKYHLPQSIGTLQGYSELQINFLSIIQNSMPYLEIGMFIFCALFPILHQVLTNWVYSRAYKEYLTQKLNSEIKLYKDSKRGIEEHNRNLVAKVYYDAFNESYFSSNSDRDITALNDVLYKRLMKITVPSIMLLLLYHLRFLFSKFKVAVKNKIKEFKSSNQELPSEASTNNN